jgi:hypothetical protein
VQPTEPDPNQRNLLFYASLNAIKKQPDFIPQKNIDLNDAVVLQDEFPVLDILNAEAAKRWRVMAINSFNYPQEHSLPFFK